MQAPTSIPHRSVLVSIGTDEDTTCVALPATLYDGLSVVTIPLDFDTLSAMIDAERIVLTLGTDSPPNLSVRS